MKKGKSKYIVRKHSYNDEAKYHDLDYIYYQDAKQYYDSAIQYHYGKVQLLKVGKNAKLLYKRESFFKDLIKEVGNE